MKRTSVISVAAALLVAVCAGAVAGESLVIGAPSDVVAGRQFTVRVVPLNGQGETARNYRGKISVTVEGMAAKVDAPLRELKLSPTTKRPVERFKQGVARIALGRPGWYRIAATDGTSTAYLPVRCHARAPKKSLYWGEIHTHSNYCKDAGGALNPEKTYTWGRDVGCLDFGTVVSHHWSLDAQKWASLTKITNGFNKPGEFVAILGYEWGQGYAIGQRWNHNNVYFLGDSGPLAPNMKSAKEFWPWLERNCKVPVICIPHHPALKGIRTEWEYHNPKYQPVVEVYSLHGNSESAGAALQGKCTWEAGLVTKALEKGYVMGFIAGGDNHGGRMGTNSARGDRHKSRRTGIAAVWAKELTRKGLWEGFTTRHTYGTSGAQRILVEFSINGHRMGEAFRGRGARKISVEVGAPRTSPRSRSSRTARSRIPRRARAGTRRWS